MPMSNRLTISFSVFGMACTPLSCVDQAPLFVAQIAE
jgi:hypothetical protein